MSIVDTVAASLMSPDLQTLTVTPPFRGFGTANGTANVAAGHAQPQIRLPTIVNRTQGFYIPYVGFSASNNVGSAQPITIDEALLLILNNGGDEIVTLGTWNATTLTLDDEQSNQIYIQKPVWTGADLDAFALARGKPSIFAANQQPLLLLASLGCTATMATSFTLDVVALISAISGLTGNDVV